MWWNSARFWNVRPIPSAARASGLKPRDILPLVADRSVGGPVAARDAVDHRGLAGAIRSDDREQLAGLDVEADVGQRRDATEPQRHPLGFQEQVSRPHRLGTLNRIHGSAFSVECGCRVGGTAHARPCPVQFELGRRRRSDPHVGFAGRRPDAVTRRSVDPAEDPGKRASASSPRASPTDSRIAAVLRPVA